MARRYEYYVLVAKMISHSFAVYISSLAVNLNLLQIVYVKVCKNINRFWYYGRVTAVVDHSIYFSIFSLGVVGMFVSTSFSKVILVIVLPSFSDRRSSQGR